METRIQPVGEPLKRKLTNVLKPNWLAKCFVIREKNFNENSSRRMETWQSLWPQKVIGSLEVAVTYFMTKKVTVSFVARLT